MIMKSLLRPLTPRPMVSGYRRLRRLVERQRSRHMTPEEVFTDIYEKGRWSHLEESDAFCSGSGSTTDAIVEPYIDVIGRALAAWPDGKPAVVDLGCGDFRVGRRLLPHCGRYLGLDIVRPLIERHQREFGSDTVAFAQCNLVADDLPDGDVCFVRQVLQHLSNDQVAAVLGKLTRYRWVFITEHYPSDRADVVPNRDKVHGSDTRVHERSGVYLSEPPFSLPPDALTELLTVPGAGMPEGTDQGVIRTFLYEPAASGRRGR